MDEYTTCWWHNEEYTIVYFELLIGVHELYALICVRLGAQELLSWKLHAAQLFKLLPIGSPPNATCDVA
jgi:hypothetical protein